ncbi:DUF4476 domain-containing protein [Myxococcus xanthus]|uniref:DUF4476 domain-containing protein n=1 Tax=Myxococcus xanthus TaxID=34 RepID=A0A7Y4IJP7_MYXXA|nr:DUF4476 domain-containing protein [Myxococcus xanthus]NOJ80528.1 DUF4476 domain-containing protein [Myxococcus xanthus]NOJ84353.1 DUF4476 domain-containing protein [Myxococcus xanthus]
MKALITSLALLFALPSLDAHAQAEMRRPPSPPPGQPMPQPHHPHHPNYPPQHTGSQVVVDRQELNERLDRLEQLLKDAEQRMNRQERNKFRKAKETLNAVQDLVDRAPLLATVFPPPPPPMPPPQPMVRPISDSELRRIHSSISLQTFAEDKMRVLVSAAQHHYFLVSQVSQLLGNFQFTQDKLAVVRELEPYILDPQNGHMLYSHFSFSSDKKRLDGILSKD